MRGVGATANTGTKSACERPATSFRKSSERATPPDMATPRELPADVAAALNRVPEARDRFAELPAERQAEWLSWIDRGEDRGPRIDEMIRRLLPGEEEVVEPGGPPPWERYWW